MISRVLDIRLRQLAMRAATRVALATFLLAPLLPSAKAHAQATTGSVRGFITISATEPAAGATVSARNIASGRRVQDWPTIAATTSCLGWWPVNTR